jgi:phosphonate transport system substrate-binding protein
MLGPLLAGLLAISCLSPAHAAAIVVLGSVASESPTVMIARMAPLTDYLSARTGLMVRFKPAPNLGAAVSDLVSGETSLAYFTPAAYLEAREKAGAVPLVSPLTKGVKTFSLIVAVPRDSPVKACHDLKGKTFAFGDRKALVQKAVVDECMGDVGGLAQMKYLDHYDNIAKALLIGDFDAGILKDTVFDQFAAKGLRKLHESEQLPGYIIAASPRLDKEPREKLRSALLAITSSPQGRQALMVLDKGYTGFAPVEDKEYDSIRKLIRRIEQKQGH